MKDFELDRPEERWWRKPAGMVWELHVLSRGVTLEPRRIVAPGVAHRRRLWLRKLEVLFVELACFDDRAILTRDASSAVSQVEVSADEQLELAAHFQGLGFHEVSAWSRSEAQLIGRELWRGEVGQLAVVTLWVDGSSVHEESVLVVGTTKTTDQRTTPCATRAAAIAAAEQRLYEVERDGFVLRSFLQRPGTGDAAAQLATPDSTPDLLPLPRPATARGAVDAVVERLTRLHRALPAGHAVVELLDHDLRITTNARNWQLRFGEGRERDMGPDLARLQDMNHGDFFRAMHADRLGRWARPPATEPASPTGSSFDYFVERYGTLTWIIARSLPKVTTHHSGNVSGGGTCVLEINANEYDVRELAANCDEPVPGLAEARVFHGGWHDGASFLFDPRSQTAEGELGIHPFDECDPAMPDQPLAPEAIVPFGFWLFDRVEALCTSLIPWLRDVQRP